MDNNEMINSVSGGNESDTNTDYVAAIQELQANTVSKEQYAKVRAENKRLLDALVNGDKIEASVEKPSIDELRKKLFNKSNNLTNLEFIQTSLDLRDALIEDGQPDPFLPVGENINITKDMIDTAERVAEIYRECVDFADGDSGIFTAELQRRTKESIPLRRK